MKNKDPNYIVKVEKAIAEKYGEEAIDNPKRHWTDEKEKKFAKKKWKPSEDGKKIRRALMFRKA